MKVTEEELEEYDLNGYDEQNWKHISDGFDFPKDGLFPRITFKAISIEENPSDEEVIKGETWVYGNYELWLRKCFRHNITERYSNCSYEIDRSTLYLYNHELEEWIKL